MKKVWLISLLFGFFILLPNIHAETMIQNLDAGMEIDITYPETVVVGREGIISILVKNNGWEEKQDISFEFSSSSTLELIVKPSNNFTIEKLAEGGTFGKNVSLLISEDATAGIHFLNLKYSQVLVVNNEIPQIPILHDIAIPIMVKEDPSVIIYTKTPESIFASAEFPIDVRILSEDMDITNVNVKIITPKDIEFRGETSHTFSKIEKNTPVEFTSQIITPVKEVNMEYSIPFEIIIEYTNDIGEEKEDSQTVSVILRPRTLMELTTDGGIWIGNFFIAPYISLGTIIGIPAGALISLLIRRNQNSKKKNVTEEKS